MKKKIQLVKPFLFALCCIIVTMKSYAQPASTYSFTAVSGTYNPTTGGAVMSISGDDVMDGTAYNIGFTFSFCGNTYTTFKVNSNGWLTFGNGTTAAGTMRNNDIANLPSITPALMPLWDDCDGVSGTPRFVTTGTVGNRVLTVEFLNWKWYFNVAAPTISFQIKLYETTNVIEFVYRQEAASLNTSVSATIGIAKTGSDYLTLNNSSSSPTASATLFTTSISTKPSTGQIYRFAPPIPCSGTPAAGVITAVPSQAVYCGSASPILTHVGSGYPNTPNISLQWQSSLNGSTWIDIAGATANTYNVPSIVTSTLYRMRVTCSSGPTSTNSDPILISVAPNPVVGVSPVTSFMCGTGGSTTINASGAASYDWAPGGQTTSTITVSPTSNTVYTVTGTLGACSATAVATVNIAATIPPINATATPSSVCNGGSTQLSAVQPGSNYSLYYIPPTTYTIPTPQTATLGDDNSFQTAMPFSFTFFGNSYANVIIASNGYVGFTNVDMSNRFVTAIPASGTPNNCIYAFWKDLNVGTSGSVTYGVAGIAPYRRFIISYNAVANHLAVAPFNATNTHSGQVILYETTNVVDVIITNSSGTARTLGIENSTGTVAMAPPGKNNTTWSVASPGEGFRFAPPVYNYSWTPTGGLNNATVYNPIASNVTANTTYNVVVTDAITGCTGPGNTSVTVNPPPTATMTTSTPTVCAGQQPSITITGTPNTNVVYSINGVNQTAVNTGGSGSVTFTPPAISANAAYALVSANTPSTTCSSTLTGGFTVNVNQRPAGQFLGSSVVCKDNPATINFISPSGGTVFPIYVTFSDGPTTYLDTATGAGENFPVPSNIPGTYNYNITALTSANGCAAIAGDFSGTAIMEIKALSTATVTSTNPGVCPGGNTDVTLTFTGDAPFSFNYYDGVTSTGNSTNSNTFTFNVTPAANTTYYVENLNDANACIANPADLADSTTVVVYDTVSITSQPVAAINACSQNAATITLTANGQNLVYTWYENGVAVVAGPNYTINNGVLTINNVTGLGGNQYYAVVTGECGLAQTSTTTTITENFSNNWSGTVSTDWNNGMNWSCGTVPIITTDVMIPTIAPNMPLVNIPNAVCHNFTLTGATATLGFAGLGNQLSIYGDVANMGGTMNGTGGTIELAGTNQSVTGPLTFDNLEITGGGVKTFGSDVIVNGILSLMSGNIELGNSNLTMTQPVAQLGGSVSSFIVTNGTGSVIGNNMGLIGGNPDGVMFHVGINGGSYTPISLTNLGDADNFSVRVMQNVYADGTGVIPTEVTNPVVDRTWIVEEGTAGGSIVNMSPYWNTPVDEVNGFDPTHVYVAHYWNGEWTSYVDSANGAPAAVPAGLGMLTTTQDSIMNFSPFTVASSGQFPLAIRLSNITATNVGARNKVQWKSETEAAGHSYELESSADGRKFSKIATVAANGQPSTYLKWDESPVQGVNYYRVKLVDADGEYRYSKVVTATVNGKDGFSIEAYPNPVKSTVSVKIDGLVTGKGSVVITDVTGKVVKSATQVVNNGAEINVNDLANGIYMLNYSDDARNESIKINKQ